MHLQGVAVLKIVWCPVTLTIVCFFDPWPNYLNRI